MNYYRRYMGDYAKKTATLSLAEHGAYNLLLDEIYSTERPLPGDHEALYRICRAMSRVEQDAVRAVADRFFPVGTDGFRRNPRADEEISIAQPAIKAARTNGVNGGRPRKNPVGSSGEPAGGHPPSPNHQPPAASLSTTPQPRAKAQVAAVPLPAWLNAETWTAYVKTRPARARTPDALKSALAKLEKFRASGHDANDIIATSLANGWQGLFAPDAKGARQGKQAQLEAHNAEASRQFLEQSK